MKPGIKYSVAYAGGMLLWGLIFYSVLYRILGLNPEFLTRLYLLLAVAIGGLEWALYYSEHITDLSRRTRFRIVAALCAGLGMAGVIIYWGTSIGSRHWLVTGLSFAGAVFVTLVTAWLVYRNFMSRL